MTYREWFALIGIMLTLMGGMAGLVRWLFASWMRSREASELELHREFQKLRQEFHQTLVGRSECQARHDRELAELRLDLVKNYPRREELTAAIDRLMIRVDAMMEKFDDLKEIVLRSGRV
jgi:hypothetical protein